MVLKAKEEILVSKNVHKVVFEIDADEVVSSELSEEILNKINSIILTIFIPMINYIGKIIRYGWMACLAPDGKFCLFKKSKKWLSGLVHPSYQLIGNKAKEGHLIHNMSSNISHL